MTNIIVFWTIFLQIIFVKLGPSCFCFSFFPSSVLLPAISPLNQLFHNEFHLCWSQEYGVFLFPPYPIHLELFWCSQVFSRFFFSGIWAEKKLPFVFLSFLPILSLGFLQDLRLWRLGPLISSSFFLPFSCFFLGTNSQQHFQIIFQLPDITFFLFSKVSAQPFLELPDVFGFWSKSSLQFLQSLSSLVLGFLFLPFISLFYCRISAHGFELGLDFLSSHTLQLLHYSICPDSNLL